MSLVSLRSTVAASEKHLSSDLSGERVLFHLESGSYFRFNPVGARVWELIREPAEVRRVLEVLLEEYDVEAGLCERDLLGLLEELAEKKLIRVSDPALP